jgi:23S rRNA pseudouridine1911/1915/1917 synthase
MPLVEVAYWQVLLTEGGITVDDVVVRDNQLMEESQVVQYDIDNYEEGSVDTRWSTLWNNHEISAIHKPANLPVSRTTRNVYNTLVQILRRESPWPDAHLLHRLDLETSGIILIGHDNASASKHQPNLPSLIKRKIYHAVVKGLPDWTSLDYECDLNTLKDSAIRCQMHKVESGKASRTKFKVLRTNGDFTLIECELMTGRKHQIRAHLASLGHAIVGDKIYSNNGEFYLKRLQEKVTEQDFETLLTSHHLLHAYQVHIQPLADVETGLKPKDEIIITDNQYSDVWLEFMNKQNFKTI